MIVLHPQSVYGLLAFDLGCPNPLRCRRALRALIHGAWSARRLWWFVPGSVQTPNTLLLLCPRSSFLLAVSWKSYTNMIFVKLVKAGNRFKSGCGS